LAAGALLVVSFLTGALAGARSGTEGAALGRADAELERLVAAALALHYPLRTGRAGRSG
jgi:hypothetical protein